MNNNKLVAALFCLTLAITGCKKDNVEFHYTPPYDGGIVTLQGIAGTELGENAANSVFMDLSKNIQNTITRRGWDLGFYTGPEFKVIINHSTGASAIALDKTDLLTVTREVDSNAVLATLPFGKSLTTVDPVTGLFADYIANTAIKEIPQNAADSKVYLISRGTAGGLGGGTALTDDITWMKVKITRLASGYSITYGGLNDQVFRTTNIVKDASYNFKYLSFTNNAASAEPGKTEWDIEWTRSTYKMFATGSSGTEIPYSEPDFVLINSAAGVTAAQLIFSGSQANSSVTYENFGPDDLKALTPDKFSAARDAIGNKWRNTTPPAVIAVFTDRYYIIHDAQGNYYKLRFTKFNSSDGGSRGRPVVEYKLVTGVTPAT